MAYNMKISASDHVKRLFSTKKPLLEPRQCSFSNKKFKETLIFLSNF